MEIITTVILAMSADGKIADAARSPARFGSPEDKAHLETQIAQADAVLFGAGTLRAYGTTMKVNQPENLLLREKSGKPPQPVQIVASRSGEFDPNLKFFSQPVPRWLVTTQEVSTLNKKSISLFEKILTTNQKGSINWEQVFQELSILGIKKLAVLGGGELVAALFANQLVKELWLTICPVIIGGKNSPTPVDGLGLTSKQKLCLLETKVVGSEIFLHYSVV